MWLSFTVAMSYLSTFVNAARELLEGALATRDARSRGGSRARTSAAVATGDAAGS
jgi:hypothetical protein